MGGKPSNNGSGNLSGSMSGNGTNLAGSNGTLEEKRNENGGADNLCSRRRELCAAG